MKIFTKKALREHDCQIIDEMMDKRYMAERMERLENRMMELEMRMERMQPSTAVCSGTLNRCSEIPENGTCRM